ncbi:Succinate dehydrogenase subunit 6 mitochondrial [Zea mays]|uniref:Succinate dehydrogenase subunit 6 mitochondrial n=1 Tax=Zea mays TaxID=4577 RepID=A0A1D6PX13_MAIZE|nr:Succinate dehydrogenase subunit 6 mitochondrial [Zea mays]
MGIGEHFEGVKQHWASNFAFLDYYKKVYGRAEPLPKWSDADVDEFIASDPVYGPQGLRRRRPPRRRRAQVLQGAARRRAGDRVRGDHGRRAGVRGGGALVPALQDGQAGGQP